MKWSSTNGNLWISKVSMSTLNYMFIIGLSMMAVGCQEKEYSTVPNQIQVPEITEKEKIKRGEYLVNTIGCADCHSPKTMGPNGPEIIRGKELSGFQSGQNLPVIPQEALDHGWMLMSGDLTAAVGPWGVSYSANITSDQTGIGSWSLEQFKIALRKGKYKGMENSRDLLPPMPWYNLAQLTEEDLEAMYLFLKSTPPVENVVPGPVPPTRIASR